MADNTEAKFILNFETAVAEIGTLGVGYLPPNPIAELVAMQANLGQILVRKPSLDQKEAVEEDKRNSREDLYKTVSPRCSSVINYCKSMGVDVNDLANLQFFARELRGVRAKKIPPPVPGATPTNTISAAQTSYANQQDWFAQFVEKVRVIPNYNSTEDQFKLGNLEALRDSLQTANSDVVTATSNTNTERTALDELLYTGAACAFNSISAAKLYIRAAFGANHPVYKALTALRFRKPSRLTS